MNVRTLVRMVPAEPPFPAMVEVWEITWVDREVETYRQRGSRTEVSHEVFTDAAAAEAFAQQAIDARTAEGFVQGTPPERRPPPDRRAHEVVRYVQAHAADTSSRQVLGDWLHERGDPFGGLVGRWLGLTSPESRKELGLQVHESVFDDWITGEWGAVWDRGFLEWLSVAVCPDRPATLAARLPTLLAHPASWLLRGLKIDGADGYVAHESSDAHYAEQPESEELWVLLAAIAETGPHGSIERLEIEAEVEEDPSLALLNETFPNLRRVSFRGALDRIWPLPEAWARQLTVLEAHVDDAALEQLAVDLHDGAMPMLRELGLETRGLAQASPPGQVRLEAACKARGILVRQMQGLGMPETFTCRIDGQAVALTAPSRTTQWDSDPYDDALSEIFELWRPEDDRREAATPDGYFDPDPERVDADAWQDGDPDGNEAWDASGH
ncbi:MAG: hypothetical protein AAGA48_02845 [Myxococcota bacterium]